jgi:hypothetical protein
MAAPTITTIRVSAAGVASFGTSRANPQTASTTPMTM